MRVQAQVSILGTVLMDRDGYLHQCALRTAEHSTR